MAPPHRGHGTPTRLEDLCDEHGAELFALACVILRDREAAVAVVVRTMLEATNDGFALPVPDRRGLARRAYVQCLRLQRGLGTVASLDGPRDRRPRGSSGPAVMARLDLLSEQQRAAIALCLYGDHTCTQAAHLLSLPVPVVANLLRSGLRDLHSPNSQC